MSTEVYIPDEEHVWLSAKVLSQDNATGMVDVEIADEAVAGNGPKIRTISLAKAGLTQLPIRSLDVPESGVEDMCTLSYLHEASILDNLQRRFFHKQPYTYTGDICIAVNPYQWLNIYTPELMNCYTVQSKEDLPPHAYAISATAYYGLKNNHRNQSILVSGESGAGKTETVKILMAHLTHIASREGDTTVDKLLKASPLLESFGNAKTARNDNSSRFGKFTQLEFDQADSLVGSKSITYLLEKSRVISQHSLERNYHILYQLLAAPDELRAMLHLTKKRRADFLYMNSGDMETVSIEGKTDEERFIRTIEALRLLGVADVLQPFVLQALAGLLFLGDVLLVAVEGDSDSTTLGTSDEASENLRICCELLGVDVSTFSKTVVTRTIEVEGQRLPVPLHVEQAISGRDALAKEIYARIFQWLVHVINFNTSFRVNCTPEQKLLAAECGTISLLDIFGFECFITNRFEQLCINYANEKLQQKFTNDVLKTVQNEYIEEEIEWEKIKFDDNAEILDMLEGKKGIVHILNEECLVPKGSDNSLMNKMKTAFTAHKHFVPIPTAKDQFSIHHYAGKVTYNVQGFMDRNKDTLPDDMRALLAGSANPLLALVFSDSTSFVGQSADVDEFLLNEDRTRVAEFLLLNLENKDEGRSSISSDVDSTPRTPIRKIDPCRRPSTTDGEEVSNSRKSKRSRSSFMMAETVTTKFKSQLTKLMEMISATDVQYVRCVKPNALKSNEVFSRSMVVEQLRSAGMIAAIRISRAAYPSRVVYLEFMQRFGKLRPNSWHEDHLKTHRMNNVLSGHLQLMQTCKLLIEELLEQHRSALTAIKDKQESEEARCMDYQLGRTKIFFAEGMFESLELIRNIELGRIAVDIQRIWKGKIWRQRYQRVKFMIVRYQAIWRQFRTRRRYTIALFCIAKMQSVLRMFLARRLARSLRELAASIRLQSLWRMWHLRDEFVKVRRIIVYVQSIVRRISARKLFQRLREQLSSISSVATEKALMVLAREISSVWLEDEIMQYIASLPTSVLVPSALTQSSTQPNRTALSNVVSTAPPNIRPLEASPKNGVSGHVSQPSIKQMGMVSAETVKMLALVDQSPKSQKTISNPSTPTNPFHRAIDITPVATPKDVSSNEPTVVNSMDVDASGAPARIEERTNSIERVSSKDDEAAKQKADNVVRMAVEVYKVRLQEEKNKRDRLEQDLHKEKELTQALKGEMKPLKIATEELKLQLADEKDRSEQLNRRIAVLEKQLKRQENEMKTTILENREMRSEIEGLKEDALTMRQALREAQMVQLRAADQNKAESAGLMGRIGKYFGASSNSAEKDFIFEMDAAKRRAQSLEDELKVEREKVALLKQLLESQQLVEPTQTATKADEVSEMLNNLAQETTKLVALRKELEKERLTAQMNENEQLNTHREAEEAEVKERLQATEFSHRLREQRLAEEQQRQWQQQQMLLQQQRAMEQQQQELQERHRLQQLQFEHQRQQMERQQRFQRQQQLQQQQLQQKYQQSSSTNKLFGSEFVSNVQLVDANQVVQPVAQIPPESDHFEYPPAPKLSDPPLKPNESLNSSSSLKKRPQRSEEVSLPPSIPQPPPVSLRAKKPSSRTSSPQHQSSIRDDKVSQNISSATAERNFKKVVHSLVDGSGLKVKLFLMQKDGKVIEAAATLRVVESRIECELAGSGGNSKRLQFDLPDLKAVRRGTGKKVQVSESSELCLHFVIKGKGELNMSFSSSEERDSTVDYVTHLLQSLQRSDEKL